MIFPLKQPPILLTLPFYRKNLNTHLSAKIWGRGSSNYDLKSTIFKYSNQQKLLITFCMPQQAAKVETKLLEQKHLLDKKYVPSQKKPPVIHHLLPAICQYVHLNVHHFFQQKQSAQAGQNSLPFFSIREHLLVEHYLSSWIEKGQVHAMNWNLRMRFIIYLTEKKYFPTVVINLVPKFDLPV